MAETLVCEASGTHLFLPLQLVIQGTVECFKRSLETY
jgi:hypothetical protein